MKRVENRREGPAENQENLGEKLKRGALLVVGKRGGHNTPVIPSWRLVQLPPAHDSIIKLTPFPLVSARKLAATLWELHHYNLPIAKMHQGVTAPPPGVRRHRHRRHHDPSPSSREQAESASSLRRHVAASLMQHHRSIQRNNHALRPVSPASYGSSMEMKVESQPGLGEKKSIVDKLTAEIETYLQTKRSGNYQSQVNLAPKDPNFRRSSLESIPLNVAMSASQDEGDEDDSASSDSQCFELDKPVANLKPEADEAKESYIYTNFNPNQSKNKPASLESTKGHHPTSLQVKFEEQMAQAISRNGIKNQAEDTEQDKTAYGSPVEVNVSKKNEIYEATEEDSQKKTKADGFHESSSNYIDNLIRSGYLLSESGNWQPENDYWLTSDGNSTRRSHASPVRQWTAKLPSQYIDIPESSSKVPSDLKANTLKENCLKQEPGVKDQAHV